MVAGVYCIAAFGHDDMTAVLNICRADMRSLMGSPAVARLDVVLAKCGWTQERLPEPF
jgi:hypothetical protein